MKTFYLFALLALLMACRNETPEGKAAPLSLQKIMAGDKIHQTFEYTSGKLSKESYYGICQDNPADEFFYTYKDNKLDRLATTTRSIYSSLSAVCSGVKGLNSEETYEYNASGKLSKIIRSASTTELLYNAAGYVEKETLVFPQGKKVYTYLYDNKGNITEINDPDSGITTYTYDSHPNPMYGMNQRPGWISPFNRSPNNVIAGSGARRWERTISYDSQGLPVKVKEDNGITYSYIYN